jgi:uncharacterized protein (TIGR00299 family) protein
MLAYLDCFSGMSGDMLLGALIDAGVELAALRGGLAALPIAGYRLEVESCAQHGLRGTRVHVALDPDLPPPQRHLSDIESLLAAGALPERVQARAVAVFRRLAAAEAHIHGMSVEEVHFHEVGAVDAIVDIVGTALGLELLGVDALYCSELPFTHGRIRSAHGELPVPAPATVEVLRGTDAVWRPLDAEGELVTPTGAAVAAALARFERPALAIRAVGYGFGRRELAWANCLRLFVGEPAVASADALPAFETDSVTVLEANIDNMTGEALGWLMEALQAAGALDVSYAPLQMKKNRPGTRLTVLAEPGAAEMLASVVLRQSATLGVRLAEMRRVKAARRVERITTVLGEARVKLKLVGGAVAGVAVEYEDARALAARHSLPLAEVITQIEAAGRVRFPPGARLVDHGASGGGGHADEL